MSQVSLRRVGESWEFVSELALEDFLWSNLSQVLGLIPVRRQHRSKGESCDIVAVDSNQQLVIIELKNSEDRYIIQQLTRYYDNLLDEKPPIQEVDYDKPIRLIAISPIFHKHNLIDKKHSSLNFELLQLVIKDKEGSLWLQLIDIETSQLVEIKLAYKEVDFNDLLHESSHPPKTLLKWLSFLDEKNQIGFLKIREKIVRYDQRIQEITDPKGIRYGKEKTKICAEFRFSRKSGKPVLFLWLPLPTARKRQVVGRMKVWTDGTTVSYVGHVPEGLGTMKSPSEWEVEGVPSHKLSWSLSYKS